MNSIGNNAFYNCKNLTDVYLLPETAPRISSNSFSFGSNKILHLPNATYLKEPWLSFGTVVPLTGDEFEGADNTIITFDDETVKQKFIGVCDYTGDKEICMWEAAAVASIPSFKSNKMPSFNELKYFTGVRTIPKETFFGCSNLISITIPEKVTSIGENAFSGCTSLAYIYCMAEEPPSVSGAFSSYTDYTTDPVHSYSGVDLSALTLYVPSSAINIYRTKEPWNSFGDIQTIEGTEVELQKCATPTIRVEDGKIKFSCDTEGVSFVSSITTPTSSTSADGSEITFTHNYKITVHAEKRGYINSDEAEMVFVGSLVKGDANGDGVVDVNDIVKITNIIMGR